MKATKKKKAIIVCINWIKEHLRQWTQICGDCIVTVQSGTHRLLGGMKNFSWLNELTGSTSTSTWWQSKSRVCLSDGDADTFDSRTLEVISKRWSAPTQALCVDLSFLWAPNDCDRDLFIGGPRLCLAVHERTTASDIITYGRSGS